MKKTILLLAMLCAACDNKPLKEYSELSSLRVLDIQVTTPEVNTLDAPVNFTITPLLSDYGGTGSVDISVDICFDPGINFGAKPECDGSNLSQQTFNFISAARTELGPAIAKNFIFPSSAFSSFNQAAQNNGVPILITLVVTRGQETVQSFRRVLFSNKSSSLNNNPSVTSVLVNSLPWSLPTATATVAPVLSGGARENYTFLTANGEARNLQEDIQVSWFSSSGTFKFSRTTNEDNNEWTPGSGPGVFVLVIRDGRGGSSYLLQTY